MLVVDQKAINHGEYQLHVLFHYYWFLCSQFVCYSTQNDLNSTGDGDDQLDDDEEEDMDAYEFLSNAVTGNGRPKPKPRITPTSSSSSSVPSNDSGNNLPY